MFEHAELDALLSAPNELRAGGKRTLTMSQRSIDSRVKLHEDNWKVLQTAPTELRQEVVHAAPESEV
ncbi:hypothetical protein D3C81_2218790 [compost metagenome]